MNIMHFSTSVDVRGAANAAYQIHLSLKNAGHVSKMYVRHKSLHDPDVIAVNSKASYYQLLKLKHRFFSEKIVPQSVFNLDYETGFNGNEFLSAVTEKVDVICLHWITGLLSTKQIAALYKIYRCPIVWVLMDQEPVTGGCHYSFGCDGFMKECGNCPQLQSSGPSDRSRQVWRNKMKYLQGLPITFIACTSWVEAKIKLSSLFKNHSIERIGLPLDPQVFRPFDREIARNLLRIPQDKKIIFFGARYLYEERKGMKYLLEALQHLAIMIDNSLEGVRHEDIHLLIAGDVKEDIKWPFENTQIATLKDEISLALAYQAADIFVCPSVEDAGPMMLVESMLCGTPVVAFNMGGAPDLIRKMETGYLAEYKNTFDLANGMKLLLNTDKIAEIGLAAREIAVSKHCPKIVAQSYLKLFADLSSGVRSSRRQQNINEVH